MAGGRELDFDRVVIGGGSGGLAAAFRASEHGARVALLEPGELGGTCVNVGCVPKKSMWLAAQIAGHIELAAQLGFEVGAPKFDWRSEEHTSELQSLMRISYAVFCLKKKTNTSHNKTKNRSL